MYFSVSYATVAGIFSLCIIISIESEEGLTVFVLDISNAFQNTSIPNNLEIVYLSLPYLYLEWFKINDQYIHYLQEIKRIYAFNQSNKSKEQNVLENFGMT